MRSRDSTRSSHTAIGIAMQRLLSQSSLLAFSCFRKRADDALINSLPPLSGRDTTRGSLIEIVISNHAFNLDPGLNIKIQASSIRSTRSQLVLQQRVENALSSLRHNSCTAHGILNLIVEAKTADVDMETITPFLTH